MNRRNTYITAIAISLIVIATMGSLFFGEYISEEVVNAVTACTAIVGAAALFYQFKRDKDLNEASFLVEYSQEFYSVYDLAELMNELEKCRIDPEYELDVEQYYQKIVGYLEWLETLASLVDSDLLQIKKIDNVMSYRFFLIVNNKQIQECELIPNREFYRGIFDLYPRWEKYKKKKGLIIVLEENSLGGAKICSNS